MRAKSDENVTTCQCNHCTNFAALYSPYQNDLPEGVALNYLTYACCALSIIGLVVTLIIHLAVPRLQKSQQKRILINLCFSVLGRDISVILLGTAFTGTLSNKCKDSLLQEQSLKDFYASYESANELDPEKGCPELVAIAAVTHFFMISTIGWMACEGIHLYYSVVAIFRIPKRRYLLKLSILGWFAPAVLVGLTLLIEQVTTRGYTLRFEYYDQMADELDLYEKVNFWVSVDVTMFHVTIMAPFVVMLIFNIIMFGLVVSALMNAQNSVYKTFQRLSNLTRGGSTISHQGHISRDSQRHKQLTDGRKQLQGSIGLVILIGATLVFNIFLIESEKTENAIAYIFIILNASQGKYPKTSLVAKFRHIKCLSDMSICKHRCATRDHLRFSNLSTITILMPS